MLVQKLAANIAALWTMLWCTFHGSASTKFYVHKSPFPRTNTKQLRNSCYRQSIHRPSSHWIANRLQRRYKDRVRPLCTWPPNRRFCHIVLGQIWLTFLTAVHAKTHQARNQANSPRKLLLPADETTKVKPQWQEEWQHWISTRQEKETTLPLHSVSVLYLTAGGNTCISHLD